MAAKKAAAKKGAAKAEEEKKKKAKEVADEEEEDEETEEEEEETEEGEGEDEDGDGDPDKLPIRVQVLEVAGKKKFFPLFFVAASADDKRVAGFNEKGVRISPWCARDAEPATKGEIAPARKCAKDVSRSNAIRRKNMLPDDYLAQAPVNSVIVNE